MEFGSSIALNGGRGMQAGINFDLLRPGKLRQHDIDMSVDDSL
jgi:hypothetical protein